MRRIVKLATLSAACGLLAAPLGGCAVAAAGINAAGTVAGATIKGAGTVVGAGVDAATAHKSDKTKKSDNSGS